MSKPYQTTVDALVALFPNRNIQIEIFSSPAHGSLYIRDIDDSGGSGKVFHPEFGDCKTLDDAISWHLNRIKQY